MPVMEEGHDELQEHGSGGLRRGTGSLHTLLHCAAMPQADWGLCAGCAEEAVCAVAKHIQHTLAGSVEGLQHSEEAEFIVC